MNITKIKTKSGKNITHVSFEIMLIFKSIFALLEIVSGIAMIFLSPGRLNKLIEFISREELYEDPKDLLMNFIVVYGHAFSIGAQKFAVFYLLSHGIIKLIVILLLWRKKLWAYPLSIAVFIGFIIYQMYHYAHSHSIMLLILTVLDIAMIGLTVLEYRNIRVKKAK